MLARRRLLEAAGRLGIVAWAAGALATVWRGRGARAAVDARTFPAYLDTLIPPDAEGPGALQLGVPERLSTIAAADGGYADLIEQFTRWLDERARVLGGVGFADLDDAARATVVRAAESAAAGSPARRAFALTRDDAFAAFYGDPRAWPGIGYRGPPQPEGFPDYDRPPQEP
jgi:Gluconate 2-dehydrogenase subunit 3